MATHKKDKNQHIQVFIRVRPLNKQEGPFSCIEINTPKQLSIKHHGVNKTYSYDRVFGPETRQDEVYKLVAAPTVKEVIAGYNCTVLAYGQTGTGKTYTMVGGSDFNSGIIPRTLAHLFDELHIQQLEFTVRVSYLELYNEEIFDLLSPVEDSAKLKLYDDNMKKGSIIVHGLTEVTVNTKSEVFKILDKGAEKRRIASTLMNAQSSRSHTVFCITVHIKESNDSGEELLKIGKLYLVDLAGSENIKQSGATEIRAREACSINQSLLTLGRCIVKLVERSGHIPYRESKLTRLLQDSLGGRTKTTLIATVSPASYNSDESINTLDYAFRAKNITNKPEINQRLTKQTLIKEYTEEIERLKRDLIATKMGKGIFLDEENYDSLMRDRAVYKEEISAKLTVIRVLQEQMSSKEKLCEELKFKLEEHEKEVQMKTGTICILESQLEEAVQEITNLQQKNQLSEYIVEKYSETEEQLKSTAKELIQVADITTVDTSKLHDKLEVLSDINSQNKQIYEQQFSELNSKIDGIHNTLSLFHDQTYSFHHNLFNLLSDIQKNSEISKQKSKEFQDAVTTTKNYVHNLESEINDDIEIMKNDVQANQCNMSENIDKLKKVIENKIYSYVVPKMDAYFQFVDRQNNHVYTVMEEYYNSVNKYEKTLKSFIDEYREIKIETKKEQSKLIEQSLDLTKRIHDQVLKHDTDSQISRTAIEKEYENVLASLSNFKMLVDKQRTQTDANTAGCLQEVYSLQEHLSLCEQTCNSSDKASEFVDSFNQQIVTIHDQNLKTLANLEEKSTNIVNNISHSKCDMTNAIDELKEMSNKGYEEAAEICKTELKIQGDAVFDQIKNYTCTIKDSKEKLDNALQDYREDLSNVEAAETNLNIMHNQIETNESYCSQMVCSVSADLDSCREGFKKIQYGRKEYKTTGETPQRKFYRYPRTLVETKPKEKLLEEFYSTHSVDNIKEEIEDDGKGELIISDENNSCKFNENQQQEENQKTTINEKDNK